MKTFRTEYIDESQLVKSLFRQLFLFQIQLEKKVGQSDWQGLEVSELIQTIDFLMEQLMDYCDSEE